jgi:hypothetical protein
MDMLLEPASVKLLILRTAKITAVIQQDVCTHVNQTVILHFVTMDHRELHIELRSQAICTREVNLIRAAQRAYNIPESTVQKRLNGTTKWRTAHKHRRRLSIQQEEFLVDWIFEQESQDFLLSHAHYWQTATRIMRMDGDTQPLGKRFVTKLICLKSTRCISCWKVY